MSAVREYAYSLGKRRFFLFGELANSQDSIYQQYIGPNTSVSDSKGSTVYYGIDSLLDFRLAKGVDGDPSQGQMRYVFNGNGSPSTLFKRLDEQQYQALNRGELGRYLVSFADNHDSFWQYGRIASQANDEQVIATIGFLICSLGTPCIYYGTEQGFAGHGNDESIREAMFDKASNSSFHNTNCRIYQAISQIAGVMRSQPPLRFGRMYYREISGDGVHFGLPQPNGREYTLAFSRLLYGREILVAYNVSWQQRNDCVIIESAYHKAGETLTFLYGGHGSVQIQSNTDGTTFVQLPLNGFQFVILG